jgi:hypothetical protein
MASAEQAGIFAETATLKRGSQDHRGRDGAKRRKTTTGKANQAGETAEAGNRITNPWTVSVSSNGTFLLFGCCKAVML